MKILITGASGLIGSHLQSFLSRKGHNVEPLRWRLNGEDNGDACVIKLAQSKFDTVVHLAGESIADRWTADKMQHIKESRILGTKILSQTLTKMPQLPRALICASAIGFYGNRGTETLDEKSAKGAGFLADLCEQWESATISAREAGIRVVNLRFGIVLSREGGALAKILLPFQMGAGGEIGDGKQYMSWIDIDDVVTAIYQAITNDTLQGPVNVVAPHPVTNKEFTKVLGKVLHRPTLIPVPAFGLRFLFGPMADEMLLSGQKVMPVRLEASGYKFHYPDLESCLEHVLAK